jgi:hypothetical protein
MAGSLAQISEKEESETDNEKEIDADLLAILLPFTLSLLAVGNDTCVNLSLLNNSLDSREPIFLKVRNLRI